MSLLDKIRSSLPIPRRSFHHPEPAGVLLGFILLERAATADELTALMSTLPGATLSRGPAPEDPLEVALGDVHVVIASVPRPVAGHNAESNAANNTFWPEAVETVAHHHAHLVVTAMYAVDAAQHEDASPALFQAFVRSSAALLRHPDAIGIDLDDQGIVYEKSFYLNAVDTAGDDLPWQIAWLTWAAWESPGVSCGSTRGLRVFGHEELEVRGSSAQPSAVRELLATVAGYVVASGAALHPGEFVEYTDDRRLLISAVGGSFVDGHALRIDLP
ncbi:MAG: DUF4261 domain-containing protein [Candidatus Phosphoribacter sp.]